MISYYFCLIWKQLPAPPSFIQLLLRITAEYLASGLPLSQAIASLRSAAGLGSQQPVLGPKGEQRQQEPYRPEEQTQKQEHPLLLGRSHLSPKVYLRFAVMLIKTTTGAHLRRRQAV